MFHRENRIRKRGGDEAVREPLADALAPQEAADAEAVWRQPGQPPAAMIRSRAYEIYIERNGGPGDALSDWLRAEAELLESGRGAAAARPPTPRSNAVMPRGEAAAPRLRRSIA